MHYWRNVLSIVRIRWRKVILDLLGHKARTLLVVLAIAVGVFAVGLVISAQSILLRELQRDYAVARTAAAILHTEPFDDEMAASITRLPEVAAAEGRRRLRLRASVGNNEWRELVLTVIPDYTNIRLDRIIPTSGQWPPGRQEMLVEQLSLDFIGAAVGDTITVELDDGRRQSLAIVGLVHDNSVPDAQILDRAFGYITPDTLEALGEGRTYSELRFTVAENETDLSHIQAVSQAVEDKLARSGREVLAIDIPPPGQHWAEEIIETLVLLFIVFGVLILFLSGFLVVNTISALLAQQIKQIGIMKLVGARRRQIMAMYFVMVLVFGLLSLSLGVPLSLLAARAVVDLAAGLLNVSVDSYSVPATVLLAQAAVGLMVPLLAALWPVVTGVQITTFQALNSAAIGHGSYGHSRLDRLFVSLQEKLPVRRPLVISLRNTVRRKERLALTLTTLILGTALFIGVLSVRDSVEFTLDNFMRYHRYDVAVNFNRLYRTEQLERLARPVIGVTAVESWTSSSARRQRTGDAISDPINVLAVPADTAMMAPQVDAGRWLRPDDENAIVVNSDFIKEERDAGDAVTLGDEIVLEVDGRELPWQVVGIVPAAANGPAAYVSADYYGYATRSVNQATSIQVVTDRHDDHVQTAMAAALAERFQEAGMRVDSTLTSHGLRERYEFQFTIIVGFLVLMAVLLATVGGLGLTTTMSINILERIREIGVLRAIGASDNAIRQIVVAEGIVIGLLSWLVGSVLAIPLSLLLSRQVGLALLGFPLHYRFSAGGMVLWLILVIFLATAASLGPARSASRLTIREVLAYE